MGWGWGKGSDRLTVFETVHKRPLRLCLQSPCSGSARPLTVPSAASGYINDGGTLELERFEALMQQLAQWELDRLEDAEADQRWLRSKRQAGTVDIRYTGSRPGKRAGKQVRHVRQTVTQVKQVDRQDKQFIQASSTAVTGSLLSACHTRDGMAQRHASNRRLFCCVTQCT